MTSKRWFIIFAVAFLTLAETGWGQSATHWSSYKIADGLSEPVFNSVSFTPQGKLIATSLNVPRASKLDGYSVSNFPAPAGNSGRICESPGGQCWALVPQGLMELKNDAWLLHPVSEIAAAYRSSSPRPGCAPPFFPIRQGCVLFLLPDGLGEFSEENPDEPRTIIMRAAAQTQIGSFIGMTLSREGGLWIGGTRGLARVTGPARNLEPNSTWQEYIPPEFLSISNLSQPVSDDDGGVTLVAESAVDHQKMVVMFDGHNWTALPAGSRNFFHAWRGPDQAIWAATAESLFQWVASRTNWVENEEISAGQIFDVEMEPGGAFWLATADGLFRGAPSLWQKPGPVRDLDAPVQCMTLDEEGRFYFIAGNQLHMLQN